LPTPKCSVCSTSMDRLHACLYCVYFGCWRRGHMQKHMKDRKHNLCTCLDLDHLTLYCSDCKDYVYDLELEYRIHQERARIERLVINAAAAKRAKTLAWVPSTDEIKMITSSSKPQRCGGLRGLLNMGSTCFMNVILQTFIHNPLIRSYFLSDQHNPKLCTKEQCLACELDKLFSNFFSGNTKAFGPSNFLHSVWMSLSDLAGYSQQDAHEFLIAVLNKLHSNCGGSDKVNCSCIVHATFGGLLQSDVKCGRCGNINTAFDPILDISLDLRPPKVTPGIKKTKGNHLTKISCSFTQPETLEGEYTCTKCGITKNPTKQLSVKKLPPVLSLQFKRFEITPTSRTKIETPIQFPLELDMTPYVSAYKNQKRINYNGPHSSENCHYRLFAVVNHKGKLDTGHYTVYAIHRDEWFAFDDHKVTKATIEEVLGCNAYMCFYMKNTLEYS
ncbi:hypothetical protein BKA69DRAFT_1026944, partial [Paraphysoderma sedebokerense]